MDGVVWSDFGGIIGWVLRDGIEIVLLVVYSGLTTSSILELLTMRDACLWGKEHSFLHVDIEGYAEGVVADIRAELVRLAIGGSIVDKIRLLHSALLGVRL